MLQYAKLQDERPQIERLVHEANDIKWDTQESELQALLIEAVLIKKYQPEFNILLKDDKSSLYIGITKDVHPRVYTLRKPELLRLTQSIASFGPYQSGYKVKQVLEIARRIFKWCDVPLHGKPCFYTHISMCSGACTGSILKEEYSEMIAHLKDFLRGKSGSLIRELKQEIEEKVAQKQFEKAATLRDQIAAIIQVTSKEYRLKPDLTLPILTQNLEQEAIFSLRSILASYLPIPRTTPLTRIEGYDISNIQGTHATASMVVAVNGKMDHQEYRHFGIKTLTTPNDFAMMKETLMRRQQHPEWGRPDVILIDGGKGQLHAALSVWKWPGVLVSIAKDPDRLIIPLATDRPPLRYKEVTLTSNVPATRLLQTIRDESHRFSRRLHFMKREKGMFS